MIIKNQQIELIAKHKVENFIKKTVVFLRNNFSDWTKGKEDTELINYILKIMDFGNNYKVYSEINIQKLLHYHIFYQFDIPLHPNLSNTLSDYKFTENIRVENFYLELVSGRFKLIKITLDNTFEGKN